MALVASIAAGFFSSRMAAAYTGMEMPKAARAFARGSMVQVQTQRQIAATSTEPARMEMRVDLDISL